MNKYYKILPSICIICLIALTVNTGASPLDDFSNWVKKYAQPDTWFLPANEITVTDTGIQYYVSISGNSWRADLTNDLGVLISSQSGSSYGYHIFSRPPGGQYYRITVYCFYGSSTCAGEGGERFFVPELVQATPTPTVQPTITPAFTTPPQSRPKPVIIPPAISRVFSLIFDWVTSLFGLTISGGSSIDVQTGSLYTTSLSLDFVSPDSDYTDGTYQTVFAEWLIMDSGKNVLFESGWNQLTTSPYSATASFTPQTAGTYYLVGVVVKQQYTYGTGWTMTENVETKEIQRINAIAPVITTPNPTPAITSAPTPTPTTTRPQPGKPTVSRPTLNLATMLSDLINLLTAIFGGFR